MKQERLFIRISEQEKAELSIMSNKRGMTVSEYVLLAVRLLVETDSKKNNEA